MAKKLLPKHPLASRLEAKGFFAYPNINVNVSRFLRCRPCFSLFFLLDVFFLEDVDCAGWYQGRIPNKNKSQCCVWAKIKLKSQKGRTSFKPGLLLSNRQKTSGMFSTLVDTKKSAGNGMFPDVSRCFP